MDIATVAVYSDPDADLAHVAEADEAVRLPGASAAETYLDVDRVVGAAVATGADALHPGYGFLSERPELPRACVAAGIAFVGPPAEVIEAMGSKLAAKALVARAGVPVLPGVTVAPGVPAAAAAEQVGYPLLVKAALGGGGRGMRPVAGPEGLDEAVASASREAASAFGDATVFLERFVEAPRHVEVQIFGDVHGTLVHLFERECSVQRRFQKLVEEAPSPSVHDALRVALCSAALSVGEQLGYVGSGTVEFVVDGSGAFYFLEVNTRLQVEHPVTELVTGLDLVELQLRVAAGEPLPERARRAALDGHAVEARLYAEDVDAGFLPAAGHLDRLSVGSPDGVRVDAGYREGDTVSTHYDALLAKVIAWAPDRPEALARLTGALGATRVHGVATNRSLLVGILRHPEFAAGRADTGFLSRHPPETLVRGLTDDDRRLHGMAAVLARRARRRLEATVQGTIPAGWRNVAGEASGEVVRDGRGEVDVAYRVRHGELELVVDAAPRPDLSVRSAAPDLVVAGQDGVWHRFEVHLVGDTAYVDSPAGSSVFTVVDRFPVPGAAAPAAGSLVAPMPGTVRRVLVAPDDPVKAGDPLVVIEAMKMEHQVRAPVGGAVRTVTVAVGQQVEAGQLLVVVEGDPPDPPAADDDDGGPP